MGIHYQPKDFKGILGISGMSDQLLTNHLALYEGYVKNVNALSDLLEGREPGTPEYAELKRRFGWEWNGMRLHELYFGNLSKEQDQIGPVTLKGIEESFGTFDAWKRDFVGTGLLRGIGWVIMAEDAVSGQLFNTWINEHDGGYLAGTRPLLIMDVFEHAFMLDYGLKRAEYVDAFLRSIDWGMVEKRKASE